MAISVEIIEDSIQEGGDSKTRLTTFALKYPRFIHPQVMAHKDFSRNAASSRATPTKVLTERVLKDPVIPQGLAMNQRGMQPGDLASDKDSERFKGLWKALSEVTVKYVQEMAAIGIHKQWVNRPLETFLDIEVVLTSSRFANFYALRIDSEAQSDIQELARKMFEAHKSSTPRILSQGEWHLPFIRQDERTTLSSDVACKVSAARCARVSYLTNDKRNPTLEEDLALYERLVGSGHTHGSPLEHQAKVPYGPWHQMSDYWMDNGIRQPKFKVGNLDPSWIQYRKTIANEYIPCYEGIY